ncbi:MAG: prepilin peptidase [Oscillospiraceae bacterium]|jgi:prepilin signal peptidase PulO-like enzyme (type II secretory pathway)|nr:prepilin peptidase [Oscillospiraceae bacterium]
MEPMIYIILFILGAAMGSFAMCQVWRMRDWQVSRKKIDWRHDHSHCLHCGYRLRWFDNIPVVSWLWLRGKCRKCGKAIGAAEILCEVGLGAIFVLSYALWPFPINGAPDIAQLLLFLLMLVGLTMLFVYDLKWKRLPEKPLIFCIICAAVFAALRLCAAFSVNDILQLIGTIALLPGLYWVLYKASGERLVGGGDWLLALPLALVAANFWVAFYILFISNLLGTAVMLPVTTIRKRRKGLETQICFGPFLIAGFLIVFFAQNWLLALISL